MNHSLSKQGFRAIRSPARMPRRLAIATMALLIVSVAPGLDDPLNLGPEPAWAQGRSNDAPGRSGDSPGRSGDAPGRSGSSSGNSDSAPGQSGGSPGNSGSASGQSGGSPGNSGSASSGGGPSRDNDRSPGNSGGSSGRGGGSDRSDTPWNGNDRASDRRSSNAAPTANARGRYNALATTPTTPTTQTIEVAEESEDDDSFSERIGDVAVELDAEATQALIESGWSAAGASAPETASAPAYAFEDQSERTRTFVTLARELNARYAGQPGFEEIPIAAAALQASFGTPWEAGVLRRPDRQQDGSPVGPNDVPATTDEAELQRRIDQMKPGEAPVTGWERMTALDVNGDGFVDRKDLIDLQLGVTPVFLEGSR